MLFFKFISEKRLLQNAMRNKKRRRGGGGGDSTVFSFSIDFVSNIPE